MNNTQLAARLDALAREISRFPVRWGERTIVPSATGGGGGDVECDDCFYCADENSATVGGCSAAPLGAMPKYKLPMGITPFSDDGGTSPYVTFEYSGADCLWQSEPVEICQPVSSISSSSSSSSSSSASPVCGIYRLLMEMTLSGSDTVMSFYISFVSGTDWAGTGA